jgi:hypothetical protein
MYIDRSSLFDLATIRRTDLARTPTISVVVVVVVIIVIVIIIIITQK